MKWRASGEEGRGFWEASAKRGKGVGHGVREGLREGGGCRLHKIYLICTTDAMWEKIRERKQASMESNVGVCIFRFLAKNKQEFLCLIS